jgi:outer membrane protein
MKRLILTALSFAMVVAAKADIIRGYVVDAETGEALAAANVFVKGTTADVRGYFEINIADGTELTAAYVGYTPSSFTAESGNKAIEVRLQRSTELRDVNVYGSRTNFGVQSSQMSAQTLSATQIKQLPRKR